MRVFTTVPQEDLRRVGAAAKAAEAEGYDGIVAPENQHDPFLALAVAGAATERIELHTDGGGGGRLGHGRLDRRALCRRAGEPGARP